MVNLFIKTKAANYETVISSLFEVRELLIPKVNDFLHKYYAAKFTELYDYQTIFAKEKNVLYKVEIARQEAKEYMLHLRKTFFKDITSVIFDYEEDFYIVLNMSESFILFKEDIFDFFSTVFKECIDPEVMEFYYTNQKSYNFFSNVLINISNFSLSDQWFGLVPTLEQRAEIQTYNFLLSISKKRKLSFTEQIKFEKEYKNHPQYKIIKSKLLKVLEKNSYEIINRNELMPIKKQDF